MLSKINNFSPLPPFFPRISPSSYLCQVFLEVLLLPVSRPYFLLSHLDCLAPSGEQKASGMYKTAEPREPIRHSCPEVPLLADMRGDAYSWRYFCRAEGAP